MSSPLGTAAFAEGFARTAEQSSFARGRYLEDVQGLHRLVAAFGDHPFPPEVLGTVDERYAIRPGGEAAYYDPGRRLREGRGS